MRKLNYLTMLLAAILVASCSIDSTELEATSAKGKIKAKNYKEETVVVANRGEGSLSFINALTNELTETLVLPDGAEPMYVVYVSKFDKLYVGDRGLSQVHIVNPSTRTVSKSIPVGNGVFHMWADGKGKRLWVNNDVDNTVSVINLASSRVMDTIELDGKPHDVFLSDDGAKAYVSILVPDGADRVIAFNANNRKQVADVEVGEDPHLFHIASLNKLFVPCQNTNQVLTLDDNTLATIEDESVVGAHGIFTTTQTNFVYVTGINVAQIHTLGTASGQLERESTTTPNPIPHNVVTNTAGNKIFVTHSGGSANQVSIYNSDNGNVSIETVVTAGTNPFGLAYMNRSNKR